MDVTALMRQAASIYANRPAIMHGGRTLTFQEAWRRSVRFANALNTYGLQAGDRVGVLEDNCIESSDVFQGAAIANVVRVPLYPRGTYESHLHMLGHTNCKLLVVSEKYAGDVENILSDCPSLEKVIIRDSNYESWLAGFSDEEIPLIISQDDLYAIRHTGGTTGNPKGVMYSHRAWIGICREWFYIFPQVNPGDKCLHVGPIAHGSGYQYVPIWLAGGCNVMVDHFDVDEVMNLMEHEQIAFTLLIPTMLTSIIQQHGTQRGNFPALKCILVGSAPVSDTTINRSRSIFGDIFYQGYGATECPTVAFMGPDQWFANVPGSNPLRACGMPLPFVRVEIWDEENNPVSHGEIGEIVAQAEGQLTGFWEQPEETEKRLINGWIKLGDIGRLDDNGYLYLLDRADDMIISGGYNIWPTEIENIIASLDGVIEIAVFGIPHEKWGETPMAVCCVEKGGNVTEEQVIEMVAKQLGSYKKPSRVILQTEPLPKTPVGKIKRKALREPFWEDTKKEFSNG